MLVATRPITPRCDFWSQVVPLKVTDSDSDHSTQLPTTRPPHFGPFLLFSSQAVICYFLSEALCASERCTATMDPTNDLLWDVLDADG